VSNDAPGFKPVQTMSTSPTKVASGCMVWFEPGLNPDGSNLPFSPSWFELRVKMIKLQILSLLHPLRADVLTANVSAEGGDQKNLFWVVFHPLQRIVCISVNSARFHMKLS
jgi:hypothetical protein